MGSKENLGSKRQNVFFGLQVFRFLKDILAYLTAEFAICGGSQPLLYGLQGPHCDLCYLPHAGDV